MKIAFMILTKVCSLEGGYVGDSQATSPGRSGTLLGLTRARSRLPMALKPIRSFDTKRSRSFWKPGIGKRVILIGASIICVGSLAQIGYHLLGEGTPTTDKAVVEGNTYPVSCGIDGTIAGILVSSRQYVKEGDLWPDR